MTSDSIFREAPPPLRQGYEAAEEQREFRASIPLPVWHEDCREEVVAGVTCLVVRAPHPRCRVIHMHGGGYFCGSSAHYSDFAHRIAHALGAEVWVPDYCLAPEDPFPAVIHQMIDVVDALFAACPTIPTFISGDSAGGGLALSLASIMRRPMPVAGILLLSPWLDLTLASPGYTRSAQTDVLFSRETAANAAEWYLQGEDPRHPLASPIFADLAGLPPVTMLAASMEVLAEDSLELAQRLLVQGVSFNLVAVPGVPHIWPVLEPDSFHGRQAILTLTHAVTLALEQQANQG